MRTQSREQLTRARALVSYAESTANRLSAHRMIRDLGVEVDPAVWPEVAVAAAVGTAIMGAQITGHHTGIDTAVKAAFEEVGASPDEIETSAQKQTEFLMWMKKTSTSERYAKLAGGTDRSKSVAYLCTAIGFWVLYECLGGNQDELGKINECQFNEIGMFFWNSFRKWWIPTAID